MLPIREWFDIHAEDKTGEYANKIIRWIRMQMQPLVNIDHARRGMDYILGIQDMSAIKNLFQNPAALNLTNKPVLDAMGRPIARGGGDDEYLLNEMRGFDFVSMPIMEKLKNIMIADNKKMGIITSVKATDPTSQVARKHDKGLIENKKKIEQTISKLYTQLGKPPYKTEQAEKRLGGKVDNGNTADFDKMSLDRNDPADVGTFMQYFHKLDWEVECQKLIDAVLKFNQVEDFIDNMTVDSIAKKAVAYQCYVSKVNGAIMHQYLTPETVFVYGGGRRKDFNDANAKCYQQQVTVKELLDRFGDSFDFTQHMDRLILAIFSASQGAIDITAISPDIRTEGWYCEGRATGGNGTGAAATRYSYNTFMNFKVTIGYMEWTSQNMTEYGKELEGMTTRKEFKDKKDLNGMDPQIHNYYEDNQPPNGKRYQNDARYETCTYCAYYLVLTTVDHLMFNFGKITYADIEGYQDFNSNFTIITYKEIGESLSLICAPFIDLINELWYKFKLEVRRSKPRGTDYSYDSLLKMAMDIFPDTTINKADKITKMVTWLDGSANSMWTWPEIDGKPVAMTSAQLNIDKPNGLTPQVKILWESLVEIWDKMLDTAGISPLREGDPGNPRDSMNNQFKALEYSLASTYYVPDMITFVCQQLAVRSMMFCQDIIQFKDYDTLAYKFLEDQIGPDALEKIEGMGKTSMHRYSVYVEAMNQAPLKQKLDGNIQLAVQNGKITVAQQLMIEDIKSPRQAFVMLAYFEQRNMKQAQQQQQAIAQQQQQHEQQLKQMDLQKVQMEGGFMLQGKKLDYDGIIQGHAINQQGGLAKQLMKVSADADNIKREADADIRVQQAQNNPNTPPPPVAQPAGIGNGSNIAAPNQPNAVQQQQQSVQPGPIGQS